MPAIDHSEHDQTLTLAFVHDGRFTITYMVDNLTIDHSWNAYVKVKDGARDFFAWSSRNDSGLIYNTLAEAMADCDDVATRIVAERGGDLTRNYSHELGY